MKYNDTKTMEEFHLTRVQKSKLRYLLEKGGKDSAVTVLVGMPDGSIATVDSFGRVTWTNKAKNQPPQ